MVGCPGTPADWKRRGAGEDAQASTGARSAYARSGCQYTRAVWRHRAMLPRRAYSRRHKADSWRARRWRFGFCSRRDEPLAGSSRYPEGHDWATFGIGWSNTADTPEIREALYRRIYDPDRQTWYEAVRGLARCGDRRIIPHLVEAIRKDEQDFSLWEPAGALLNTDLQEEVSIQQDIDSKTKESAADDIVKQLLTVMH